MEIDTFVLHRFNGDEIFRLDKPWITVFPKEEGEGINLYFYADTKRKPIQTLPDTEELHMNPNAELYVSQQKFDVTKFVGRRFSVPLSYSEEEEDHVSCFYYCEHEDLNNNKIRILERDGNKFLVHWTGTTTDVNYYDESKPGTRVEIKGWFTFKNLRKWEGA